MTPVNHREKVEHFMIKIAKNGLNCGEEDFEVSTPGQVELSKRLESQRISALNKPDKAPYFIMKNIN